jgi:hypothetical protein
MTTPFRILAWRGRQRDDLLDNLHAARSTAHPPPTAPKIAALRSRTACTATSLHGDLPRLSPHVTCSTSLLDQLPPVDITLRGSPLTDLLQPAYRRFGN